MLQLSNIHRIYTYCWKVLLHNWMITVTWCCDGPVRTGVNKVGTCKRSITRSLTRSSCEQWHAPCVLCRGNHAQSKNHAYIKEYGILHNEPDYQSEYYKMNMPPKQINIAVIGKRTLLVLSWLHKQVTQWLYFVRGRWSWFMLSFAVSMACRKTDLDATQPLLSCDNWWSAL